MATHAPNGGTTPVSEGPEGWRSRIRFLDQGPNGPVAYRPDQFITNDAGEAVDWLLHRSSRVDQWAPMSADVIAQDDDIDEPDGDKTFSRLYLKPPDPGESLRPNPLADVLLCVEELRSAGFRAQPNHVFFSHSGAWANPAFANPAFANPAFANPAFANPAFANPAFANPAFANPAFANPAFANPAFANPAFANPAFDNPAFANPANSFRRTGLRQSTARPVAVDDERVRSLQQAVHPPLPEGAPHVIVLDTGLPSENGPDRLRTLIDHGCIVPGAGSERDRPDSDENRMLDGAAGHGTFIAGLINQVAPGSKVSVYSVLEPYGDGDESAIIKALRALHADGLINDRTIVNLSFGGYAWDQPFALARAIRTLQGNGAVVVSSAGNDGTWLPSYPAALPDVVSVGALGPFGPAPFSNWGPWVRACAPGVDLLSLFFTDFDGGGQAGADGIDPDKFQGWARWSGTSFAAPMVAAALAREMMRRPDSTAKDAVERIVDSPTLMRIPFLGTVVNVA